MTKLLHIKYTMPRKLRQTVVLKFV